MGLPDRRYQIVAKLRKPPILTLLGRNLAPIARSEFAHYHNEEREVPSTV